MTTQHTITTAFPESEQGDSIFSAEYHYRPESASALPVVIFTLYPIQELHGLGQALAAAGHPCTVATFRSFPWEDAAEEAAYIYRLLAAHAPFDWGMPCLYGLGFDALTALRLASAMPAGTFSALALGYFSTALQTSRISLYKVL